MKKILILTMLFLMVGAVALGQKLRVPPNGIYESTAGGNIVDGEYVNVHIRVRIGVNQEKGTLLFMWDSNQDGSLEDEEVYTYYAQFLVDGIAWTDGLSESYFSWVVTEDAFRMVAYEGDMIVKMDFIFIGTW